MLTTDNLVKMGTRSNGKQQVTKTGDARDKVNIGYDQVTVSVSWENMSS